MAQSPSIFGGACIVAGVCVGAGILALPSAGAGAWTGWSILVILLTMIVMTASGWMLLETFRPFPNIRASFHSVTKELLGPVASTINNLAVYFVGAILLYAYTTTAGQILQGMLGLHSKAAATLYVIFFGAFVWWSTRLVDRISTLLVILMVSTFGFSIYGLVTHIDLALLLNQGELGGSYAKYALMLVPVAVTSFGYHHSVASMRIYYRDERRAGYAILGGTGIAAVFYVIWLLGVFGNVPRTEFGPIMAAGGEVDTLLSAIGGTASSPLVHTMLTAFSMAAILSSFIGVGLGLFDYMADLLGIEDSRMGRFKTSLVTFLPPLLGSLLVPFGFVFAISYAGAVATIWTCIIPGLLVIKSRRIHANHHAGFTCPGGNALAWAVIIFGVLAAIFHLLNMASLLPVYTL
ncbi:aromatic amino acid transporter [Castellaniella sp.]|uniref:aromatic amino acid transporter n=1 Tax=Castellaniella sp. TaxID=1955812 RepID=UPI002AFE3DF3|nr:aromatic amino acid transporter [Castellaniella sp.]